VLRLAPVFGEVLSLIAAIASTHATLILLEIVISKISSNAGIEAKKRFQEFQDLVLYQKTDFNRYAR
jgi:hypothetical protein